MIPGERDEAVRDLSRTRDEAVSARLKARQQLKALLLRHGRRYKRRSSWTEAHERYLAEICFAQPAQEILIVLKHGNPRPRYVGIQRDDPRS